MRFNPITVSFFLLITIISCRTKEASRSCSDQIVIRSSIKILRMGLISSEGHPVTKAARRLSELVNTATQGQIEIQVFPGGSLGGEVEMQDMGEAWLSRSIERNSATTADRITLANTLLISGNAEAAFAALGTAVSPKGKVEWSLLRLRILLATDRLNAAEQFADAVLGFHPGDPEVMHLMKR